MQKKINKRFFIIAGIAIILTLSLTTAIFYRTFEKQVVAEIKSYTYILKATNLFEDVEEEEFNQLIKDVRITIIQKDGSVKYDSDVSIENMENHRNRPEVIAAIENGEGKAIRKSATVSKNTFYYAVKLDNGDILRAAKEASSIWSIFKSAFPAIGGIFVTLIFLCIMIAHYLTKSIIKPIEQIAENLDNMDQVSTYKELMPFVKVIRSQHEDIMKSAKMRQQFTANVSHELKTPLTSISGYSELIENGMATDTDITRFAKEINRSSQRLLILINDIIKLSELDTSEVELQFEDVNVYNVAKGCIDMLNFYAEENGVKLHIKGETAIIKADRGMIEELIYNLCDNAIRYSKQGGNVWVTVEVVQADVKVSVKDDGIGISEKNQKRIFERFYRVDKSRTKKTGGTGLGLAIVKHIVERHNAEIKVQSKENQGTKMIVTFKN